MSETSSKPKLTKDVLVTKTYGSLGEFIKFIGHWLQTAAHIGIFAINTICISGQIFALFSVAVKIHKLFKSQRGFISYAVFHLQARCIFEKCKLYTIYIAS